MSDPKSGPTIEAIPRAGHETMPEGHDPERSGPADWGTVQERLRAGEATTWLSARGEVGVHTRPVFAAWTGTSFVVCSNPSAVKTHRLTEDGHCSLALDLGTAHLVVEAVATRLVDEADLARASTAFDEVYGWPTTVSGDLLDAPYAAPSSGGPPFQVFELVPRKAFVFPTNDQFEPTRLTF